MAAFAQPSQPASSAQARSSSPPAPPARTTSAASRQLPAGPCNWRSLDPGQHANTCGCRQFWLNDVPLLSNGLLDQRSTHASSAAWCFCGHHACFHKLKGHHPLDDSGAVEQQNNHDGWGLPEDFSIGLNQAANPEYIDQLPSGLHGPSKPHMVDFSGLGLSMAENAPQIQQTHPSCLPRPTVLHYNGYLPSTQSSSKPASHSNLEAGKLLRHSPIAGFTNHVANERPPVPQLDLQNLPQPRHNDWATQSATEVATPSNAGTPALRETDEAFNAVRTTLDAFNKNHLVGTGVSGPPIASLALASHDESRIHSTPIMPPTEQNESILPDADNKVSPNPQLPPHIPSLDQLMAEVAALKALLSTTPNLRISLLSLSHRLEALETTSFSHVPMEELQEKLEFFDGRLLDVEGKVDELEKVQAALVDDKISSKKKTKLNASFGSNTSFSEAESVKSDSRVDLTEENQINYSAALAKLSTLEQRLVALEVTALPTRAEPWEIEVVCIPWGRGLKGIWATALEASQMSKIETQGSSAARSSSPIPVSHISDGHVVGSTSEWTNGSQDWLSPRACGPTSGTAGIVYQRLKSRGFVQTIEIRGNSACKIEATLDAAFSDSKAAARKESTTNLAVDELGQRFLGLQVSYIPLRKVHKSSRLRHLSYSELITPSLWTAEFLNSSVFMQTPTTGQRRLFITTAASYAQDSDFGGGCTWQILRELPRVYPLAEHNGTAVRAVGEADANEQCWAWDSRLDPPVSVHSSFSSGISYHSSLDSRPISPRLTERSDAASACSDKNEGKSVLEGGSKSNELARPLSPITPVSEFPLSRQSQQIRNASMPLTQPQASLATIIPKRQVASFEHCSPTKNITKRRRFSRTPDDVELMAMWNLTPRRSREPPSPRGNSHTPRQAYDTRQAETMQASSNKGKLTPQFYATPFSNVITIDEYVKVDEAHWALEDTDADSRRENSDDDEEKEEDGTDNDDASMDLNDEAWEGVEEDEHPRKQLGEAAREFHDADEEDDELVD